MACNLPTVHNGTLICVDDQGTDKATAYSMQSKSVSYELNGVRKTDFVYSGVEPNETFKPRESMSAYAATFNHQTNSLENKTCLGSIFDNHGTPCFAIDIEGYLHVVYGSHHHPFVYRKFRHPNASAEWGDEEVVSFVEGQMNHDKCLMLHTEEIDLQGEYTSHKDSNLATRIIMHWIPLSVILNEND
jgi:hypothetical protein